MKSQYSNIIKRSFQKLKDSRSYIEMERNIRHLLNSLEHIDEGNYINGIRDEYSDSKMEQWMSEHHSETFLGSGNGIYLPTEQEHRLQVLLYIFDYIEKSSFEDFIEKYYSNNFMIQACDGFLLIAGICTGLKGNSQLALENMERHSKWEMDKINKFNHDISLEFENVLLNDIELKYVNNKDYTIMGDYYNNVHNSTIINRSYLLNTLEKNDDSTIQVLLKLKRIIEESQNEEATGLFNDFLEELSLKTPQKRRLKSFWNGITENLPHIKNFTDIVTGISSLFA